MSGQHRSTNDATNRGGGRLTESPQIPGNIAADGAALEEVKGQRPQRADRDVDGRDGPELG